MSQNMCVSLSIELKSAGIIKIGGFLCKKIYLKFK